jgi:hypothetical protein
MAINFGVGDAVEVIAEAVRDGTCVLFLGAGVHGASESFPGAYPEEQRPPVGRQLSQELARRCHLDEHYKDESAENLQRVALFYELGRSRKHLVDAVSGLVHDGKQPSPMLLALARLDFPLVITTNYDQLFERALEQVGKQPRVSIYSHGTPALDLDDLDPQRPIVYKLHGDVSRRDSIVITDDDYIDFLRLMNRKEPDNPLSDELLEYLALWSTLFVGYGLHDYNLRLLFHTLRWSMDPSMVPLMYSVDYEPDALIRDVWENKQRWMRFVVADIWKFVPTLCARLDGEPPS